MEQWHTIGLVGLAASSSASATGIIFAAATAITDGSKRKLGGDTTGGVANTGGV
jgi:hypothetical protein